MRRVANCTVVTTATKYLRLRKTCDTVVMIVPWSLRLLRLQKTLSIGHALTENLHSSCTIVASRGFGI